jgi:hypothetical protein
MIFDSGVSFSIPNAPSPIHAIFHIKAGNVDLVSITESAKYNPRPQMGSLVEARIGRGHWFYVALGLFRQMPPGVDGSDQLMANILSVRKTK